ncbi:MAG: hypothetical protein H7332_05125 [Bdellovibrionales bacterium]|nr:hypothetical protein [Ramlibacter sp.]
MSIVLKRIAKEPSLAYYYGQKGLRSVPARKLLSAGVATWVNARTATPAQPAPGSVAQRLVQDLEVTGFAAMPDKQLDAATLARVREQLAAYPLYDYYGSGKTYSLAQGIPADVIKIRHESADLFSCKPLMDLANDPDILAAVAARLGAKPTIASAEAWWTFGEHNQNASHAFDDIYHRDVDDLRFVKLFLYLTDTDLHSGAHRFVLGSHNDDRFTRRGAINDADVDGAYAPDKLLTVTGTAGTSFLEETWGIHRALLATQGRRLIFSVLYTLAATVPFGPGKPALPLPPGYDSYVNRRLFR